MAQTRVARKSAVFQPGEIPIFIDSLKGEEGGAFPARWDLKSSGVVEIMEMAEEPVIGFVETATISPLMRKASYLPRHFTIEFDAYFHNKGNEAYYLLFDNGKVDVRYSLAGIHDGENLIRTAKPRAEGWKHLSLSFNQRALQAFLDGERLVNAPNIDSPPTKFSIKALSHNRGDGKYAAIRNVRVMEGGMPLYERLVTDGRFVTNRIQFASGQAVLQQDAWPTIREVVAVLKEHPELGLSIEGHTDGDGTADANQVLGKQRAEAVKEAIIQEGINAGRLSTVSFGEKKPLTDNTTEEGKYQNRRVVFVVSQ